MAPNEEERVLSTRGLTMDYPGMRALDSFDLDIAAGEIHGIVGANGAGKSTLIKLLSGLQQATSGTISVGGNVVTIRSSSAAQRLGISVVHQELPLFPNLSAAQNVVVGREGKSLLSRADRRRVSREYDASAEGFPGAPAASRLLEHEGLYAWQVVAVIRAMSADARVLVLDEPTSSLTLDERNALHKRLRALAAHGLSVLYVSHFLDDILDVASVVSVLRDGRLVHRGPTSELDEEQLLAHMTFTAEPVRSDSVAPVQKRAPVITHDSAAGLEVEDLVSEGVEVPKLVVEPGQIVGLYGLEDSGARRVVEAVFGLHRRVGTVRWRGRTLDVRSDPRRSIAENIVLVTGDRKRTAIGQWSVERNHALPELCRLPLLSRARRPSTRQDTEHSIARFRVKGAPRQQMGMLSGGNQQKILLARWMNSDDPTCLLLDEPTHGVDVGGRRAIHEQLRLFAAKGNVVLLHSTDPEEIAELCDVAVPFVNGRPLGSISSDELTVDRLEFAVRASTRHVNNTEEPS